MGFETTSTTLAGNATWQRTGRIINFLEKGIPFGFLAYFSKMINQIIMSIKSQENLVHYLFLCFVCCL